MRYEGNIFRPPSEAYSLIVQVTIGCAHNDCTFCSMFKDKQFRVRKMSEIMEDLEDARNQYSRVSRIFLADGDALVLSDENLIAILDKINELFPECERVGIYGSPQDVLRKNVDSLKAFKEKGLGIVYIGAESGSDRVLDEIKKGASAQQITEAVRLIESSGLQSSVTFISGLSGATGWEEHAVSTGEMISKMEPSYVGLLTLMVEPGAPIFDDINNGKFELLPALGVIDETIMLIENINVTKDCVFRSNHASNYFSLKGTLPRDKQALLDQLHLAKDKAGMLKEERYRRL